MFKEGTGIQKVYIACGYTNLRNGIDGLAALIQNEYALNPFDKGTLFLFCGRKTDRIKGLLWEGDGFLLLYKRLEKRNKYQWPRSDDELKEMTMEQYRNLMSGLTIFPTIHDTEISRVG